MKRCNVVCLLLCFAACCFLNSVSQIQAQERVIKLKYANFFPPMHKMSKISEEWCKEVEKRTNGRVTVSYFPGGILVPPAQAYEGTVKNLTDVAMVVFQYNPGRFPLTEVMCYPLGVKNATQGTNLIWAWYEKFKPKEYDDVKVLFLYSCGPSYFATAKPIDSISKLKGQKIRAAADMAKVVTAMGAVPVSIPLADSYDGIQRGVIQGSFLPTESLKGYKFGDLLKGVQMNDAIGNPGGMGVVMNKEKWDALPPDIQKIIEQVSKEWRIKTAATWDEIDKEGLEYGISKGMKVFTISKEEKEVTAQKMKPILAEYVANMKKRGLPGEESLKFCQDYLAKNP